MMSHILPAVAFQASTFFGSMLAAAVFAVLFMASITLAAEDRSKAKLGEYAMTAGICGVIFWLLSMVNFFPLGAPLEVLGGTLWVCCSWLDFSLLRSVVAVVVLCILFFGVLALLPLI